MMENASYVYEKLTLNQSIYLAVIVTDFKFTGNWSLVGKTCIRDNLPIDADLNVHEHP